MPEMHIQSVFTDEGRDQTPAEIRERLRGGYPPGATRRMTTLGLMVGSTLSRLEPGVEDAIVYATGYAESCALEGFLDSFPTPSPTLFQTSIHPSGVQQLLIGRQRAVRELLPLSGGPLLGFHALRAAFLSRSARVLLCGGEERGTWLLDYGLASDRTFAFAAALTRESGGAPAGRATLTRAEGAGELGLAEWFDLLHGRRGFDGMVAPGWRLELEWHASPT
ncbi:MAG TPA: hypothetical protein VII43_07300 [Opitutaceae bacterium]